MATHLQIAASVAAIDLIIKSLAAVNSREALATFMDDIARDLGFCYYALIHHDDLVGGPPDCVDIKHYPSAVTDRLFGKQTWRRDPIIRSCFFTNAAFLWSELSNIIQIGRADREAIAFGAREGLNEGITVPSLVLGQRVGSCTFAGMAQPERAGSLLGMAQLIGIFAFQAAKRVVGVSALPADQPRLHPRPRDCIVLAGRGLSNKQIARSLGITPRTVDGYLTEARKLFKVRARTELVASAILAGEVGVHELRQRQPE